MPDIYGVVDVGQSVSATANVHSTNISSSHSLLLNRDAPEQHPISAITDLSEILSGIDQSLATIIDDWSMDESGYLYLLSHGNTVVGPIGPFQSGNGGGAGGAGSTFAITITNLLDSRVIIVPDGEQVVLRFNYSSVDQEGMDDGAGIGQVVIGGVVKHTFSAVQGENTVDITDYLASGTNNVSIRITNSDNVSKLMSYTITVAAVYLSSSFDASVPYAGAFVFPYTPTGIANKTMHFELDGVEIGTDTVTTSGRQQSYTIPGQSHGSHILRAWFTCDINGLTVSSNVLHYGVICTVDGNDTPIIAVTSPPLTGVEQYSNIVKKYRVYNPASLNSSITLEVDGDVVSSLTVDRTEHTWTYRADVIGEITQTIRCGDVYVSWTQNITESSIKAEAETGALALHLSSYGRSNNEANPGVWENNNVSAEFTNFNFKSDGWVQDDDDITVLRVTGDARLNIPYRMFAYDFRTTGKTLEFEIATRDVLDYDAEVMSCYSGGRGFRITAQQLRLASEQSALGTRYKENEHIRVSFVAEKKTENRLLLCYINGIMTGAVQYPAGDDFSQMNPVGITVGSNDCTTDIYNIRAYDNSLTRHQILGNWIADTQQTHERLSRYNRNDVYDAYGQVVISKLPTDLPYLIIQCDELPKDKEDNQKTCSGYFAYPSNPKRSFSFTDAKITVQGTSSQYYYRKNYKLKYKNGFVLFDGSTSDTYQMNDKAVPTDTFTMKADVASSEGAFNVVLSMLYNDLCPYKTPAQVADNKVRQCIEGFPIVIFWDNGNEVKFLGKYNFNNDKGTEEVFGFKPGDESWEILENGSERVGWHSADFSDDSWKTEFEARYPDKNTDITRLKALAEWLVSTDTDQATNSAIQPVMYGDVEYTSDTKEYRLAKFSAELADHFIEDAVIFYYLFTEIFLSIDQREKNAFPTYLKDEDRWIVLFYDADSSCGTDNKGNMAFDYYLEDIDYTAGGDPIYNGQNSVLWKNIRATRHEKVAEMYKELRDSKKISYEAVSNKFATHQSKWPEAIFNEDMYIKCLEPLILDGDDMYLPMLQGKKEQWMKWWLYNRFRYLDSKYNTGTSNVNYIHTRARSKANIKLKSYVNMYGRVAYNAARVEKRMNRGQEYEFEWGASGAEDAVVDIYDADLLTSLGDLSPLMLDQINVSVAPHITSLKLGDGTDGYINPYLKSITFGNNRLLRSLDVRNCSMLGYVADDGGDGDGGDLGGGGTDNQTNKGSIELPFCTNIEEIYCEGTSLRGLTLPQGGILKTLHLPGTMRELVVVNQPQLSDFIIPSYSQLTTIRLENAGVLDDMAFDILHQMPANSRVRIVGFDREMSESELNALIAKLDTMRGLDENGTNTDVAQIGGRIYVEDINGVTLSKAKKYVGLTVEYGSVYLNSSRLVERTLSGDYTNGRVTNVGAQAFRNCNALTGVSLPNVTSISGSGTFNSCSSMRYVYLPNLTSLSGEGYFTGCSSLIDLNFASLQSYNNYAGMNVPAAVLDFPSLTSISGSRGFSSATNLQALVLRASSCCTLQCSESVGYMFSSTPILDGTGYIYVPAELLESYKVATNWSVLGDQFRPLEEYTVDGTITGELDYEKMGVSI